MLKSSFPAKILLFGEYTVLSGSKALAIPYKELSGFWTMDQSEHEDAQISRASLRHFLHHKSEGLIDYERLKTDVEKGLWFESTIPQGYGLGSSGALIAAIYRTYGLHHSTLLKDKMALANLENHFHGSSSGIDPLVSFVQNPLLIHSFQEVEILSETPELKGFFLLNSGRIRQSGPLVSIYKEKIKDPEFNRSCAEILAREVNFAIESLVKKNHSHLFHHLWLISKFQWDYFPEMIPTQVRSLWHRGLESGEYVLKLCGAGGGGFILGYSDKLPSIKTYKPFELHELRELQ
jgi:mevalonate kinase